MRASLIPQSLSGRLFFILLFGVIAATGLSFSLQRRRGVTVIAEAHAHQLAARVADTVKMLNAMPHADRATIASALTTPTFQVQLGQAAVSLPTGKTDPFVTRALQETLGAMGAHNVFAHVVSNHVGAHPTSYTGQTRWLSRPPWFVDYAVSLQLRDGVPVTFLIVSREEFSSLARRLPMSFVFLILCLIGLVTLVVRMITHPLRQLAEAASEFGRNIRHTPLPERGPFEVRSAAAAFNAMQERINRYVEDRTYLLAAISHDLQTPLTRLRLRLGQIRDDELQEKFANDVTEMQTMIQEGLDFARSVDSHEPRQQIDLNTLLDSVRADFEDMGHDVTVQGQVHIPYVGQPLALGRCFTNLVGNAIKYGRHARVVLEEEPHQVRIQVQDGGPGIPPGQLEAVFRPFYRLEGSRNRATGGTGLGLTIARNIVFAHGGTLKLRNMPAGGLEAVIELPR